MILLSLREPNFRCRVTDRGGNPYELLLYARTRRDLLARLRDELLFTVEEVEPYDFEDWKKRAAAEARKAREAREAGDAAYEYKARLWAELKPFLFDLSNGKCGYCEARVRIVSPGDVEHYRPKKKVDEDPDHPGYYWLAYEIENYLPCCTRCNSERGKRNRFPLEEGSPRARTPEETERERPLLLNPFRTDPREHLRFLGPGSGDRFGEVEGATEAGRKSVEIYNLNRGDLVKDRREKYRTLQNELRLAQTSAMTRRRLVREVGNGSREYCFMARAVLVDWLEKRMLADEQARIRKLEKELVRRRTALESLENDRKMLKGLR